MKRLSRIYDPIAGLGVERAAAQRQSRFICQRCRLRSTTHRPSTLASQFSTSSRLCAEVAVEDQNSKEVATTESDDGLASGKYKLATTWDGLEWVGTPAWYEKTKRPVGTFRAFGPRAPITDREQIRDELLKSIIEVYTIRRLGYKLTDKKLNIASLRPNFHFPRGIRIGCDQKSQRPIFYFISKEVGEGFAENLKSRLDGTRLQPGEATSADSDITVAPELVGGEAIHTMPTIAVEDEQSRGFAFADLVGPEYGKWSSISLKDLDFRFAVAKRVLHRTGVRLTDPDLAASSTAGSMYNNLWTPAPPKKLAERLADNPALAALPNVKVSPHRITMVHKERAIGRWKVIKEELEDRGIPATGTPKVVA